MKTGELIDEIGSKMLAMNIDSASSTLMSVARTGGLNATHVLQGAVSCILDEDKSTLGVELLAVMRKHGLIEGGTWVR